MTFGGSSPYPVIQSFFPNAVTLGHYILQRFPDLAQRLAHVPNETRLRMLLDTAVVADIPLTPTKDQYGIRSDNAFTIAYVECSQTYTACVSQEQLVHESIYDLLSDNCSGLSYKKHLLAKGFRMIQKGAQSSLHGVRGLVPIEQAHNNTLVAELKSSYWKDLLTLVGPSIMRQLLLYTCIFIKLKNSSFYQITGTMIHELGVKPEPVPAPHYIPNWVENIHASIERADCCSGTETKRKIPLDASHGAGKRARRERSSRLQRKNHIEQNQDSACFSDNVTNIVKEKLLETEHRSCRRQRKRQRLSAATESELLADPLVASTNLRLHVLTVSSTCNNIPTTKKPGKHMLVQHNGNSPQCKEGSSKNTRFSRPSNSSILIQRSTMYYQNLNVDKHDKVYMCMPNNYMLNLPIKALRSMEEEVDASQSFNSQAASEMVDTLLVDIFPKQFGRQNVIDGTQNRMISTSKWLHPIQWKPNRNRIKIPPRLHQVKRYFETICRRHSKCQYLRLLNRFCPLMVNSPNQPISMQCSSYAQVNAFIKHCIKAVFPQSIWGSQHNLRQLFNVVNTFIGLRKHETLSIKQLLQSIKMKEFGFLSRTSTNSKSHHLAPSEMWKREEILKEFLYWLFQSYILPLLSATFYITDNSQYRNRTFYFRKDVWNSLSKPALEQLISLHFTPFDQSILDTLSLDYATLRLLPKGSDSVRPITNMRRRILGDKRGFPAQTSSNSILVNSLRALTFEKESKPELLGSSIMKFEEFYNTFSKYKQAYMLKNDDLNGDRPQLYFSKVDIKSCFDSIDQGILINIINKVMGQDEYLIRRYSTAFTTTGGKVHFKHKKLADIPDQFVNFPQYAEKLAETFPNTIFVDNVLCSYEDKDELLELINEHVTSNVVKIAGAYYKQTIGIPQGSCLSTILCSYFYGNMEHRELGFLKSDPDALLMRFVDDFLCISTRKETVERFTIAMHKGFARYGCQVSHSKSLVNFDMTFNGSLIPKLHGTYEFPWCGFLIDTRNLEVFSNYQQYLNCHIQDTVTTEFNQQPGWTLVHKAMLVIKPKLRPIFVHAKFNRQSTIGRNIFEAFIICAFKFFSQVAILKYSRFSYVNDHFILKAIWHIILTTTYLVKTKLNSRSVIFLGLHAFHLALRRKSRLAPTCLKTLHTQVYHDLLQSTRELWEPLVGVQLKYPFTKMKY